MDARVLPNPNPSQNENTNWIELSSFTFCLLFLFLFLFCSLFPSPYCSLLYAISHHNSSNLWCVVWLLFSLLFASRHFSFAIRIYCAAFRFLLLFVQIHFYFHSLALTPYIVCSAQIPDASWLDPRVTKYEMYNILYMCVYVCVCLHSISIFCCSLLAFWCVRLDRKKF